jgi:hypothetical protein
MRLIDRFFPVICTLLYVAGLVVLFLDLMVWRPN